MNIVMLMFLLSAMSGTLFSAQTSEESKRRAEPILHNLHIDTNLRSSASAQNLNVTSPETPSKSPFSIKSPLSTPNHTYKGYDRGSTMNYEKLEHGNVIIDLDYVKGKDKARDIRITLPNSDRLMLATEGNRIAAAIIGKEASERSINAKETIEMWNKKYVDSRSTSFVGIELENNLLVIVSGDGVIEIWYQTPVDYICSSHENVFFKYLIAIDREDKFVTVSYTGEVSLWGRGEEADRFVILQTIDSKVKDPAVVEYKEGKIFVCKGKDKYIQIDIVGDSLKKENCIIS